MLCDADEVILIGDNRKKLERSCVHYRGILERMEKDVKISCRSVNKNDLKAIISAFSQIIESYEDCVFDLTGGEALYLVGVGIMMERYKERIRCHRFNFKSGTLSVCDPEGRVSAVESFCLSVEDNIEIYGGHVVRDPKAMCYTYPWDFNDDFLSDIESMWAVCRKNTGLWNMYTGTLKVLVEEFGTDAEALEIRFDMNAAMTALSRRNYRFSLVSWITEALQSCGVFCYTKTEDGGVLVFKNEQIKRCLTLAGHMLELVVASKLRSLTLKNGEPCYHDVQVGVVVDWDAIDEVDGDERRTVNEIDVVAMRGTVPTFVSCKNGGFGVEELYKLNSVATRFGNKYAKKILIVTDLEHQESSRAEHIRSRANEMGICLLENVDAMDDQTFESELKLFTADKK